VEKSGQDSVEIDRTDAGWVVASRDGYPADVEKIRGLLLAMADATIVESKTARPEMHARLGLQAPEAENAKGVRVTATAEDGSFSIVIGHRAQGSYRYARRDGEEQTWLVDQDPELPESAGDWLEKSIVDIDSGAVQSVTIAHPDGEVISISKADDTATDFTVADVPDGRELTYATVANGIGGALNGLELDDVRRGEAGDDAIVTEFTRFDGLGITVRTESADGEDWLAFEASGGPEGEAASLNERLSGWQFKVAGYKANLLKRRWEDILQPVDEESEESDGM